MVIAKALLNKRHECVALDAFREWKALCVDSPVALKLDCGLSITYQMGLALQAWWVPCQAYQTLEGICRLWSVKWTSRDRRFIKCAPPYQIIQLIRTKWGWLCAECRCIVGLHPDIPLSRQYRAGAFASNVKGVAGQESATIRIQARLEHRLSQGSRWERVSRGGR